MGLVAVSVLSVSVITALIVYYVTENILLSYIDFIFLPVLSLTFWVCKRLIGIGPDAFIPTWVAIAMVGIGFFLFFSQRWTENGEDGD